jgi:hypothetical protein
MRSRRTRCRRRRPRVPPRSDALRPAWSPPARAPPPGGPPDTPGPAPCLPVPSPPARARIRPRTPRTPHPPNPPAAAKWPAGPPRGDGAGAGIAGGQLDWRPRLPHLHRRPLPPRGRRRRQEGGGGGGGGLPGPGQPLPRLREALIAALPDAVSSAHGARDRRAPREARGGAAAGAAARARTVRAAVGGSLTRQGAGLWARAGVGAGGAPAGDSDLLARAAAEPPSPRPLDATQLGALRGAAASAGPRPGRTRRRRPCPRPRRRPPPRRRRRRPGRRVGGGARRRGPPRLAPPSKLAPPRPPPRSRS